MVTEKIVSKIKKYFLKDYFYEEIIALLKKKHNVNMSPRKFKRIIKECGLRRKAIIESSEQEIGLAILAELEGSGCNLGYRAMWQRLRKAYKFKIKQKTVSRIQKILDPEGVSERRRHRIKRRRYTTSGPHDVWHCDVW